MSPATIAAIKARYRQPARDYDINDVEELTWHVVLRDDGRFVVIGLPSGYEDDDRSSLVGLFTARPDAQVAADAANVLIADDTAGRRLAALRRLVDLVK